MKPRRPQPPAAGSAGTSTLVYSTRGGRHCRTCGRPESACRCRSSRSAPAADPPADGKVRVRREKKGRKGKTVTTISGLGLAAEPLDALAGELKRLCGSGGGAKDGVVELQGDHVDRAIAWLSDRGYTVVRAGG